MIFGFDSEESSHGQQPRAESSICAMTLNWLCTAS